MFDVIEKQFERAKRLFNSLHNRAVEPGELATLFVEETVVLPIGYLHSISYKKTVDGETETYYHEFDQHSQPVLCASFDGRNLYILAGGYKVTAKGIEG